MDAELEQKILSESALCQGLGIDKKQLDYLRLQKGFPCIRLHKRVRVYLVKDVLRYILKAKGG
jgi:hypothetical protein